jgi:quinoprotein glucose dehydrogenase
LLANVVDAKQPAAARVESLFALEQLKANELKEAAAAAVASPETKLRAAGRVVLAKADPVAARTELPKLLVDPQSSVIEKQMALDVMGSMPSAREIDDALAAALDQLLAGKVSPEWTLDLLEAAQTRVASNRRTFAPLKDKLNAYDRKARDGVATDPLARYRDVTHGGDADRGKAIFINSAAVYCQRCHKLDGQGGEVGPDISAIAKDKTRDYLLEAIVDPNKQIAKGYESVILTLDDGRTVSGVLRAKTETEYVLVDADGKVSTYAKATVEDQKPDKSAMPDDLHKKLSRRELRDLVEFLSQRK